MTTKTLISVENANKLDNAVFIDCRANLSDRTLGHLDYVQSHISDAHYLHLEQDLSGPIIPGETGRHPLPGIEQFAAKVASLGIDQHTDVIVYDDNGGAFAARAWWMLRWLGHNNSYLLDGGFSAWQAASLPLESGVRQNQKPRTTIETFKIKPSLTRTTSSVEIAASLNLQTSPAPQLTDARDPARYRGEVEPIDSKAGHIPGAICLSFNQNLTPDKHFKSSEVLKAQFLAASISEDNTTICYCGSGVTACHNIIALLHAGFPEPTLYVGSWSDWITDNKRPIATKAES